MYLLRSQVPSRNYDLIHLRGFWAISNSWKVLPVCHIVLVGSGGLHFWSHLRMSKHHWAACRVQICMLFVLQMFLISGIANTHLACATVPTMW